MDKSKVINVNPSVVDLITANPGIDLTTADLQKAQNGDLQIVGSLQPPRGVLKSGCITSLTYFKNGKDLSLIRVGGTFYSSTQISNLDDFRERLQEAANFGHKISFCYYVSSRKMNMLNIYPCGCQCKCENPQH